MGEPQKGQRGRLPSGSQHSPASWYFGGGRFWIRTRLISRVNPWPICLIECAYWQLPAALLTVLARDGKVARIFVDAVKGTLVGER